MKKLQKGLFSNGIEEFFITDVDKGIAFLYTRTGVKFLEAKSNSSIKIGEKALIDFLNSDLIGFSRIEDTN